MTDPRQITEHPFVSIVMATHNRLSLLKDTLDTLYTQSYPKDRYEIIVVDDNSIDGTGQWLHAQPTKRDGVLFVAITLPPSGPAKARNAGIQQARGEYVMITDDDCRIDASCLAELVKSMLQHPCGGIGGRVICQEHAGVVSHYCTHIRYNVTAESADTRLPFVNTANGLFPRAVLRKIRGFDENYHHLGAIDLEMCQRIIDQGYQLRPCPSAVVLHLNKMTMRSLHTAFVNQSRGAAYIHAKRQPRQGALFIMGYAAKLLRNLVRIIIETPLRILWHLITRRQPVVEAMLFPILDRTTKIASMWGDVFLVVRSTVWRISSALVPPQTKTPELTSVR
ncbi:MAG TPA: glycosyltransferase [Armatimonadota bacterium]|jgi:GT2 family glycosyltransferase